MVLLSMKDAALKRARKQEEHAKKLERILADEKLADVYRDGVEDTLAQFRLAIKMDYCGDVQQMYEGVRLIMEPYLDDPSAIRKILAKPKPKEGE